MAAVSALDRALQAAEGLRAEGKKVSTRTVRERAGVANRVALEAARLSNATFVDARMPLPQQVARLANSLATSVFDAAMVEARKEFDEQRGALMAQARELIEQIDELHTNLEASRQALVEKTSENVHLVSMVDAAQEREDFLKQRIEDMQTENQMAGETHQRVVEGLKVQVGTLEGQLAGVSDTVARMQKHAITKAIMDQTPGRDNESDRPDYVEGFEAAIKQIMETLRDES